MKIWDTSSWRNKKSKYYVIALSAFMLIVLSVLSISIGRVSISFRSVIDFFLGRDVSSSTWHVIYNLRLPRLIGAVFAGAALSVSGLIFQNIFQNPLVSSDLLGVASGSCAGAAFAIVLGLSSIYVAGFSFLVGIVSVILCILLSEIIKRRNNLILVFAGIIIGKFMDSVVGFLKYFADPESQLGDIVNWQLGTISKVNINKSKIMMIVIGICLIIAFLFRWRVNLLSVGEKDAFSLGVNTKVDRMILIILSTVLTAGWINHSSYIEIDNRE